MSTGYATSANTFVGNALQGIYIAWSHTAVTDGTIDGTTEMAAEIKLNLFGVANALEADTIGDAANVTFYVLLQNPYDSTDEADHPYYNERIGFDGFQAAFVTSVATSTIELQAGSPLLTDVYCGDLDQGKFDSSECSGDTTIVT